MSLYVILSPPPLPLPPMGPDWLFTGKEEVKLNPQEEELHTHTSDIGHCDCGSGGCEAGLFGEITAAREGFHLGSPGMAQEQSDLCSSNHVSSLPSY